MRRAYPVLKRMIKRVYLRIRKKFGVPANRAYRTARRIVLRKMYLQPLCMETIEAVYVAINDWKLDDEQEKCKNDSKNKKT